MAFDYNEFGIEPERQYRPYLWLGEDQDHHVLVWNVHELQPRRQSVNFGEAYQMQAMDRLQHTLISGTYQHSNVTWYHGIV